MKIYISGPMSALSEENYNKIAFDNGAKLLEEKGFEPVNPWSQSLIDEGANYSKCLGVSLQLLSSCDGILMLPDWDKSVGAVVELECAKRDNMKLLYTDDFLEVYDLLLPVNNFLNRVRL